MTNLVTIAAVAVTLALGSQAVGRDSTKMTVKMKPQENVTAEERSIQPAVQKGPVRPSVQTPDGKSISSKGVTSTAEHPGTTPK